MEHAFVSPEQISDPTEQFEISIESIAVTAYNLRFAHLNKQWKRFAMCALRVFSVTCAVVLYLHKNRMCSICWSIFLHIR